MTAMLSTGLETTPTPDLRKARAALQKLGLKLFVMGLALGALMLMAGWFLLAPASGGQPNGAALDAQPEAVTAVQASPPVWKFRVAPLPPKLPREWRWQRPAVRFDSMFRERR
jgi:hypothetical protein